jgi:hypothetical protein
MAGLLHTCSNQEVRLADTTRELDALWELGNLLLRRPCKWRLREEDNNNNSSSKHMVSNIRLGTLSSRK